MGVHPSRLRVAACLIAAGIFLCAVNPSFAQDKAAAECSEDGARAQGAKQKLPELTGIWHLSDGGDIEFHVFSMSRAAVSGQTVTAFFAEGSDNGDCPFGANRGAFLDGAYDGGRIAGKMVRCTNTESMITECKMDPTYKTDFYTRSITKDEITGCWKTEYYANKKSKDDANDKTGDGADKTNIDCPYTRDSSQDGYVPFTLTRKEESICPDTEEVKHITEIAERAATFIRAAKSVVSDGKVKQAMESSETALNKISGGLGRVVALGEKCDALHGAMKDLRKFKDAIDEVNNASCGPQSAAAFDHLFTSAGDLGDQFGPIEGLGPLFYILAQNETFFQDVSGALNPEQRWADQFAGVEGYTPTCPSY